MPARRGRKGWEQMGELVGMGRSVMDGDIDARTGYASNSVGGE